MSMSKSPLSYDDIREALQKALEATKGIKITLESHEAAVLFQHRANYFRRMDRKENFKIFPIGHELNPHGYSGLSEFDKLRISVRGNTVELRKYSATVLKSEELE